MGVVPTSGLVPQRSFSARDEWIEGRGATGGAGGGVPWGEAGVAEW